MVANENTITIARGTTLELIITPIDMNTEQEYILSEGEKIIFTVKASSNKSGKIYLQKILTVNDYDENGHLVLSLLPADTANLQEYNYCYDCILQTIQNKLYQFIEVSIFQVMPACGELIEVGGE